MFVLDKDKNSEHWVLGTSIHFKTSKMLQCAQTRFKLWRDTEVDITGLTRNQFGDLPRYGGSNPSLSVFKEM